MFRARSWIAFGLLFALLAGPAGVAAEGLDVVISNRYQEIKVGDRATIPIDVRNTGTLAVRNVRAVMELPYGWESEIDPPLIEEIVAGGEAPISITVTPPRDEGVGEYSIQIEARGEAEDEKVKSSVKEVVIRVEAKASILGGVLGGIVQILLVAFVIYVVISVVLRVFTMSKDIREIKELLKEAVGKMNE